MPDRVIHVFSTNIERFPVKKNTSYIETPILIFRPAL